jgi:hypothetical protein
MCGKQVKCCNCGFLVQAGEKPSSLGLGDMTALEHLQLLKEFGLHDYYECTHRVRDEIARGKHLIPSILACTRHEWSYSDFKDKPKDGIFQFLNSRRKCPYFFPYNPGYSAAEHLELQREAKTHKLLTRNMLWAAAIGALAAIIIQLIFHFI